MISSLCSILRSRVLGILLLKEIWFKRKLQNLGFNKNNRFHYWVIYIEKKIAIKSIFDNISSYTKVKVNAEGLYLV